METLSFRASLLAASRAACQLAWVHSALSGMSATAGSRWQSAQDTFTRLKHCAFSAPLECIPDLPSLEGSSSCGVKTRATACILATGAGSGLSVSGRRSKPPRVTPTPLRSSCRAWFAGSSRGQGRSTIASSTATTTTFGSEREVVGNPRRREEQEQRGASRCSSCVVVDPKLA